MISNLSISNLKIVYAENTTNEHVVDSVKVDTSGGIEYISSNVIVDSNSNRNNEDIDEIIIDDGIGDAEVFDSAIESVEKENDLQELLTYEEEVDNATLVTDVEDTIGSNNKTVSNDFIVKNVTANSSEYSITLSWDNPVSSDFKEVEIYRGNTKIGSSSTGEFTESSLLSNFTYDYKLYAVNNSNEKGDLVEYSVTTLSDGIELRGGMDNLNRAYGLGNDISTSIRLNTSNNKITWKGSLANRVIEVTGRNNSYSDMNIYMFNSNGERVSFLNLSDNLIADYALLADWYEQSTKKFVVPKGVEYITIGNPGNSMYLHTFNVLGDDSVLAAPQNVTHASASKSITLNWDENNNIDKVVVYRDNRYIGETTTNSFTEKALLSNYEYTYTLYAVDGNNNVSDGVSYTVTTPSDGIELRGLTDNLNNAYAYDGDISTNVIFGTMKTEYVTWNKDISGREMYIKASANTRRGIEFSFLDENNDPIEFLVKSTEKYVDKIELSSDSYNMSSSATIVVPKNAVSMMCHNVSGDKAYIYEIIVGDKYKFPVDSVSNISSTSFNHSVQLNWDRPLDENYKEIAIYRNGVKVGTSSNNTFTDTSLLSNEEYTYTLTSVDKEGVEGKSAEYIVKTTSDEVEFRGVNNKSNGSNAFDHNLDSFETVQGNKTITWSNDLTNKVVKIKTGDNTNPVKILVKDSKGNNLKFVSIEDKVYVDSIIDSTGGLYNIIIPKNAASISLETTGEYRLYEVKSMVDDIPKDDRLQNISYEAKDHDVKFKWIRANSTNYTGVQLYRNGYNVVDLEYAECNDSALLSNETYSYVLVVKDKTGDVISSEHFDVTTSSDKFELRGIKNNIDGSYAFDHNLDSFETVSGKAQIVSPVDLSYCKFALTLSSGSDVIIKIKDAEDNYINFLDENTKEYVDELRYSSGSKSTFPIMVMRNSATIEFISVDGSDIKVYEILHTYKALTPEEIIQIAYNTLNKANFTENTKPEHIQGLLNKVFEDEVMDIEVPKLEFIDTADGKFAVMQVVMTRGDDVMTININKQLTSHKSCYTHGDCTIDCPCGCFGLCGLGPEDKPKPDKPSNEKPPFGGTTGGGSNENGPSGVTPPVNNNGIISGGGSVSTKPGSSKPNKPNNGNNYNPGGTVNIGGLGSYIIPELDNFHFSSNTTANDVINIIKEILKKNNKKDFIVDIEDFLNDRECIKGTIIIEDKDGNKEEIEIEIPYEEPTADSIKDIIDIIIKEEDIPKDLPVDKVIGIVQNKVPHGTKVELVSDSISEGVTTIIIAITYNGETTYKYIILGGLPDTSGCKFIYILISVGVIIMGIQFLLTKKENEKLNK